MLSWKLCKAGTPLYTSPTRHWKLSKAPHSDCNGFQDDIWATGLSGASACVRDKPWGKDKRSREELGHALQHIQWMWDQDKSQFLEEVLDVDEDETEWGECSEGLTYALKLLLIPSWKIRSAITPFLLNPFKILAMEGKPNFSSRLFKLQKWMHDERCPSVFDGDLKEVHKCQQTVTDMTLENLEADLKRAQPWTRESDIPPSPPLPPPPPAPQVPQTQTTVQSPKPAAKPATKPLVNPKIEEARKRKEALHRWCSSTFCTTTYTKRSKISDCLTVCERHTDCGGFCFEYRNAQKHSRWVPSQWFTSAEEKIQTCLSECNKDPSLAK
eukprot:Cvel_27571.t2-p1 / transcript=Cvel_27571.t2 / gene=Cvel_27571 / organism=Chromera_velia_CCMP2878 / gene_product=Serine/threonine-protein kinase pakA, putative / transcript_product=Serine/threonine-protein kinase pakA, putative / location=Cvel_scaffold3464:14165-15142(-) / protein_length=326 / sequence_SO=supercontig / SO=protein_coding / is_pseudo=false